MNLSNPLKQAISSFSEFWAARAARERAILVSGTAIIMLALIHTLLVDPALSGRRKLSNELPPLRQQVAQMQALVQEAAALSKKAAAAPLPVIREDIEAALSRKGLKAQSVMLNGGIVQVKLAAASFAGTLGWLDEMQKTALFTVIEANIVALSQPDTVDATLTLRQPGSE